MTDKNEDSGSGNGQNWGEEMNRPEHENTYQAFLDYSKWTSVVIGVILVFLLVFVYD